MKKSYLLSIIFIIFLTPFAFGQYFGPFNKSNDKFKDFYIHTIEPGEKIVSTWYHYIVTYHKESDRYILRLFHPEKQLLLSETRFLDKKLEIKDGLEKKLIYPDNTYAVGNYKNNREEGEWKEIDFNNQTIANYYFVAGKREGKGTFNFTHNKPKREDYYEKGKKNGNWKSFYENGRIQEVKNYSDDKLDGPNRLYDSTGVLNFTILYSKGEVLKRIKGDNETKVEIPNHEDYEQNPYFIGDCIGLTTEEEKSKCNIKALYKFLGQNIKYPTNAQRMNVSGRVFIKFIIEKDGSIGEVKLLTALCESLEVEALRVIKMMPKWSPGYQDGKPVRVHYNMPIIFKLD